MVQQQCGRFWPCELAGGCATISHLSVKQALLVLPQLRWLASALASQMFCYFYFGQAK
jgi:hypothetical protein